MKIPGVDPITLQQIKHQTTKPAVQEAKSATIFRDQQRDHSREKEFQQRLGRSVKKLNNAAEVLESPLRFEIVERGGRYLVQIIDGSSNRLLREVAPEKVLEVTEKIQKVLGLLVDELI